MAPRGPSFGHYHLQGIGNAAATANTSLECPAGKGFVAASTLDHREFYFYGYNKTKAPICPQKYPFLIIEVDAFIFYRGLLNTILYIRYIRIVRENIIMGLIYQSNS